jgi:hypothetical protein
LGGESNIARHGLSDRTAAVPVPAGPDLASASRKNHTRGSRGRTTVASEIHLTADQIERARGYLFSHRANLVADIVAAVFG